MTPARAQTWVDAAAFHVQDKKRILAEMQAIPEAPPEAVECAKNLVLLCEVLLDRATAKYLESLK
jgi:hypothetical protein